MKAVPILIFAASLALAPGLAAAQRAPAADPGARGYNSLGADWGSQQDEARAGVREGRYVPLTKVIAEIGRLTPGKQLDAGLEQAGGRPAYRVRWDANGRRIDYIVDATTGAIIRTEGR